MWVLAKEGKAICLGALIMRTLQVHYSLRFAAKTKTGGNKYIVVIHVHEHSNHPRARSKVTQSCHGGAWGHHILCMYFFPVFSQIDIWVDAGLMVACWTRCFTSSATLWVTAWPAGFAFHEASVCTKPLSSRKQQGLSHGKTSLRLESTTQGILSLWYMGDILFLLFLGLQALVPGLDLTFI